MPGKRDPDHSGSLVADISRPPAHLAPNSDPREALVALDAAIMAGFKAGPVIPSQQGRTHQARRQTGSEFPSLRRRFVAPGRRLDGAAGDFVAPRDIPDDPNKPAPGRTAMWVTRSEQPPCISNGRASAEANELELVIRIQPIDFDRRIRISRFRGLPLRDIEKRPRIGSTHGSEAEDHLVIAIAVEICTDGLSGFPRTRIRVMLPSRCVGLVDKARRDGYLLGKRVGAGEKLAVRGCSLHADRNQKDHAYYGTSQHSDAFHDAKPRWQAVCLAPKRQPKSCRTRQR